VDAKLTPDNALEFPLVVEVHGEDVCGVGEEAVASWEVSQKVASVWSGMGFLFAKIGTKLRDDNHVVRMVVEHVFGNDVRRFNQRGKNGGLQNVFTAL
jgi:hypothetical protein